MESGARAATLTHVDALDGARGAAVAGVLLFHGGHLRGGYLGVDFFFTLSGFLITSLLLAESRGTGSVGLGGFWSRRARRLLPALAVLMVGVAIYCVTLAPAEQLDAIRRDAFATLAYVANWHAIFSHQNYWAIFQTPSPLDHTWSLAIEEQFYLVWPLVFVALLARWKRDTPRAVFVTAIALAAVSAVLMFVLYDPSNSARVYYGTDTRAAAAVLMGAALAAWLAMRGPTERSRRQLEAVGVVGAIILALAWTRLGGQSSTLYRGGFLVCGLCATAVIAAAVHPRPGPISRVLSFRPLCALGLISYAVYLYHWPIDIVLDSQRVGLSGWPLFFVQTAVVIAAAVVSYRFIEQPIRKGAFATARLRVLAPSVALGLVVLIVASTAGAQAPVEQLKLPVRAAMHAFRVAPPGSQRVLLVGNSIAAVIGPSFRSLHARPPLAVLDNGIPGCTFLPGATEGRALHADKTVDFQRGYTCDPPTQRAVVKQFRPAVVFWMMSGPPNDGVKVDGHWIDACSAEYARRFRHALRDEIRLLGSTGARVVVTTAAYPRYYNHGPDEPTTCENRLRRSVAAERHVQLIDLAEYICPHGQCRQNQGGVRLRYDGEHYSGPGGKIVAQWLIDQLDQPAPTGS